MDNELYIEPKSTLIESITYFADKEVLFIVFKKYYVEFQSYYDVPYYIYEELINANSVGRYYLDKIKTKFSTHKKQENMANKRFIQMKIDVTKINKDWIFPGEKGNYLDLTLSLSDEEDKYGNIGMITQKVPKSIWEDENKRKVPADKRVKGEILGNAKEFAPKVPNNEAMPGVEGKLASETMTAEEKTDWEKDLPF